VLGTFSGNSFPIYLLSLFYASGCLGIYRIDEVKALRQSNEFCIILHNFIAVYICIRRFNDVLGKKVLVSHCKIYKGKESYSFPASICHIGGYICRLKGRKL
jgi:hypothetical protein